VDLPVHYEDRLVATISADAQATRLAYADAWNSSADSFPVSLAMPIRPEPYEGEQVLPWLMNLLPEGEPLRAMTRALGAAPEDALGLIAQTGNDLAGALSIEPQQPCGEPGYRPIPDVDALERIIEELPSRPFLVGEDGVSMSLAGAQEKLPVAVI
jgi:serine/threonine-protein kinase HipA